MGIVGLAGERLDARRYVVAIANAWTLAALISAGLGVLQYFGLAESLTPWVSQVAAGEAYANLRQRNQFATLCSIGLMAVLWHVARWSPASVGPHKTMIRSDLTRWVLSGAGALLLAVGNAASGSRTGLLQWGLVAAMALGWWYRGWLASPSESQESQGRMATLAVVALGLYLMCLIALPWLLAQTTGIQSKGLLGRFHEQTGCASRRFLWANVLHLIGHRPWFGWGWEELDFAHFVTLYPTERFCDILDNAHNLPLHLAVELGVPFAVVVCGFLGWLVGRARPWQDGHPTRQLAWGVLVVVGVHSLLEYPLWYGPFQMAAGLSVWLLWITPRSLPRPVETLEQQHAYLKNSSWARILMQSGSVVLIVFLVFTAWDYWRVSQLYLPISDRAAAYQEDTMGRVRDSLLFRNQVDFAELTTTPLAADNAAHLYGLAQRLLHFSPEPRVVEKLVESAVMLGRDDEAAFYLARFAAAFPQEHARWADALARHKTP